MGVLINSRLFWAAALLASLLAVSGPIRRGLERDPRFIAVPGDVVGRLPAWADPELDDRVEARLKALGPISLIDLSFEEKVRGALEGCPVIARVRRVTRAWPNRYSLEIVYRRPSVVIERDGEHIPMTWDGIRLPEDAYPGAMTQLYPIRGIEAPLPEVGGQLEDRRFREGVATLAQLAPNLAALQPLGIRAIDVSALLDPARGVVLHTRSGIAVRWGRPRGTVGENPVELKIEYLLAAQERLDALDGYVIDVRWDKPYVRESLTP